MWMQVIGVRLVDKCKYCGGNVVKSGFTSSGHQRYRCRSCGKSQGTVAKGRKPIGEKAMTNAERQAKFQQRKKAGLTETMGSKPKRPADLQIPGTTIADLMEKKHVSKSRLRISLNVTDVFIDELLKGRRHISRAIAVRLGQALGPSTSFWVDKEEYYRAQLFYYASDAYKSSGVPFAEAFKQVQ